GENTVRVLYGQGIQTQITTHATPITGTVGVTLNDTAGISSEDFLPVSGTVTFTLTAPDNTTAYTETRTVTNFFGTISTDGSGTASRVPTQPGIYHWVASFTSSNPSYLSSASGATDDPVTIAADTTPPSVTIDQALGQADPTTASPIHFVVN